jgi:NAD+ synthase (glutamine-hydrolysing)
MQNHSREWQRRILDHDKKDGKEMRDGFIKAAAVTPEIKVADCMFNVASICKAMDEALAQDARILVFPELCLTGYTCNDLFWQERLLEEAMHGLRHVMAHTKGKNALVFVGLPWEKDGKLYNVAAALCDGRLLGLVPKRYLPNYNEFYEARHFTPGTERVEWVDFDGTPVPFGMNQLFCADHPAGLVVAAEICEDLWAPNPPSIAHALAGANVIVNLSASDEVTGKNLYRESLISGQSARLLCGYIYASAGEGESTQDLVFGGHNLLAENGHLLAQSKRFSCGSVCAEFDISRLRAERRRMTTFETQGAEHYEKIRFHLEETDTVLTRYFDPAPFVPSGKADREARCEEIFTIQASGLKKRLQHTGSKSTVVGISGGLDSTLALLVMTRAHDMLGLPRSQMTAVTMPGFGTTDRTYHNACELTRRLGAELLEVDIRDAVNLHFRDIGQDPSVHDVTYENCQARERTQVLMDIANKKGGMVIGTGDMSELALGWATYNGDHMSMYAVNCSVPKTLVRHLVRYYADTCGDEAISQILYDVLDTPVSPELLPPENGQISQKTEDLVGPYELHDFFLYYLLRFGYAPAKIYRVAKLAFAGTYDDATILKWLKKFYWRFFSQQFKRSCIPDGPKVGSVALSPRGDLRMPSDACVRIWMDELEQLS